jgi:HK97 family phage portal protein
VTDHPAAAVLRQPNSWTVGSFELIRQLTADALIRNEGGLATVTRAPGNADPLEIIRWQRGTLQVDLVQPNGEPVYRMNGTIIDGGNVVHVRNALDRSGVSLAREAIGVAIILAKHAGGLFGKAARPGGVLSTPKPLGDEGVKRMVAGWRASMDGADNAGKTAVLWDGATWQQLTMSSVDAQFAETWGFMIIEIARAFNLPPSMIGDLSRATWSNSEQMGAQFLVLCLEPWLQAIEAGFNRALFTPEDRDRFRVRIRRDDLTRADLGARADAYSSLIASRVVNPNTVRQWEGLPPYDGGDEYANPNITTPAEPAKTGD